MEKLIINKLPTRTWNRLGVNEAAIKWNAADAAKLPEESISLSAAEKKTAHIAVRAESEYAEKTVTLTVAPGGELTVYEDIAAANKLAVRTDIILGENAKLRLVQVQSAVEGGIARSAITADCADGAGVELVQILLGAGDVYTDCLTELRGDASTFKADVGYIARGTQKIDVNLVCNHYGKHTESEIAANGALMDSSEKIFRGTIDFKTGSSDSVGNEKETVLMLGENVVNKTVPLILCAEENVVGNHGATIGELDAETLFYFESRGISRAEAENILARSAVERLARTVGDAAVEERIMTMLNEEL